MSLEQQVQGEITQRTSHVHTAGKGLLPQEQRGGEESNHSVLSAPVAQKVLAGGSSKAHSQTRVAWGMLGVY